MEQRHRGRGRRRVRGRLREAITPPPGSWIQAPVLLTDHSADAVMFRVWQLGQQNTGRLLLWADQYGTPLSAGTYKFTFFGVAETPSKP